jgi:hypothetical protein
MPMPRGGGRSKKFWTPCLKSQNWPGTPLTHPPPPKKVLFWGSKYPYSLSLYMFYVSTLQDHVLTLDPHAIFWSRVGALMHGFES